MKKIFLGLKTDRQIECHSSQLTMLKTGQKESF